MTTTDLQFQMIEGNWHDGDIVFKDTTNDSNLDTAPALDITNLTVEMYLKPSPSDPDPTPLSSTDTTQIEKTDSANGKARVHFTNQQTSTPLSQNFWRIDVVNSSAERRTVMTGDYGVTDV